MARQLFIHGRRRAGLDFDLSLLSILPSSLFLKSTLPLPYTACCLHLPGGERREEERRERGRRREGERALPIKTASVSVSSHLLSSPIFYHLIIHHLHLFHLHSIQ